VRKVVTLLFLRREGEILLAMKKRGFGEGKWNGVGGKVEGGESVVAGAVRECQEEIGVTPKDPQLVGRLTFYDETDPDFCHDTHIFVVAEWEGEPAETEEMRPQWFKESDIPYDRMWADDHLWMPLLLQDKLFQGRNVVFHRQTVAHHDIQEVIELDD
jgi:8-oxo-dGTP pyrophosphatase MutT (NUDIX family)